MSDDDLFLSPDALRGPKEAKAMSDEPMNDETRTYGDAVRLIANCFTAFQEQPLAERLDVIAIATLWDTTPETVEHNIRARWDE